MNWKQLKNLLFENYGTKARKFSRLSTESCFRPSWDRFSSKIFPISEESLSENALEHGVEKYFLAYLLSDGNLFFVPKFKWFFMGLHHETCALFDLFFALDGWARASNPELYPNPTLLLCTPTVSHPHTHNNNCRIVVFLRSQWVLIYSYFSCINYVYK